MLLPQRGAHSPTMLVRIFANISSTQSWGIALTIRAIRAMLDLSGQIRAMLFQIAEICIDVTIDGGRCRFLLGRGQPQLVICFGGGSVVYTLREEVYVFRRVGPTCTQNTNKVLVCVHLEKELVCPG